MGDAVKSMDMNRRNAVGLKTPGRLGKRESRSILYENDKMPRLKTRLSETLTAEKANQKMKMRTEREQQLNSAERARKQQGHTISFWYGGVLLRCH